MSDLFQTLAVSASGMKAQAERLRHASENIANADTPGYRRKTIAFQAMVESGQTTGMVQTGRVQLDQRALTQVFDPSHPMADENGHYDGSNVDLVVEIADAREAQRSYEANLRMFDQARQMSTRLLELLRR
jgi:flagellar basal-body rod protein FlgC